MDGLMMGKQLLLHSLLWRTERLFHDKEEIRVVLDDGGPDLVQARFGAEEPTGTR